MFLGLIGGREVALRVKEKEFEFVFTNREGGNLGRIIGHDLWKAFVGLVVSLGIALGIQTLV